MIYQNSSKGITSSIFIEKKLWTCLDEVDLEVLGKMPLGKMPPGKVPPGKLPPGKLPPVCFLLRLLHKDKLSKTNRKTIVDLTYS